MIIQKDIPVRHVIELSCSDGLMVDDDDDHHHFQPKTIHCLHRHYILLSVYFFVVFIFVYDVVGYSRPSSVVVALFGTINRKS